MQISDNGLTLIRSFEGLGDGDRSTPDFEPYLGAADHIWTLGYGYALTTLAGQVIDADVFGAAKAAALAKDAMQREFGKQSITREEAAALLGQKVQRYVAHVAATLGGALASTTQCQFDAMVSFAYNTGNANFDASSVRRLHVAGQRTIGDVSMRTLCAQSKAKANPSTLPIAFARWSNSNGQWTLGLFRRRLAEVFVYGGHNVATAVSTAQAFSDR